MSSDVERTALVETYLSEAVEGRGRAAARLALDRIDRGFRSEDVIVDLLAASQYEVGERWLANEWTVADEHLASGSTQHALDAVASTIDVPDLAGSVLVVCAEGDWHSLPSQMMAEMLRARGYAVACLGASTPVDHVLDLIRRRRPDAVVVSCNLPLFFGGVARLADAAHTHGIPVLAGGRAMGTDESRARLLGADGWAPDIDGAVDVLQRWRHEPPVVAPGPTRLDESAQLLDAGADDVADDAFDELTRAFPQMSSYDDAQLARTREDLAFITRYVAAALLVCDPTVLTEFLGWLRTLLANRGVPPRALEAGLDVLAPMLAGRDSRAGQLLAEVRSASA